MQRIPRFRLDFHCPFLGQQSRETSPNALTLPTDIFYSDLGNLTARLAILQEPPGSACPAFFITLINTYRSAIDISKATQAAAMTPLGDAARRILEQRDLL